MQNVKPRRTRLLALGHKDSEAYGPIYNSLSKHFDLTFLREKDCRRVRDALRWFYDSGCDAILFPNPYGNPKRRGIYHMAKSQCIQTIVFDRGGLPGSWFFDTGFNADSETYSISEWDRPLSEAETARIEAYIADLRTGTRTLEEQHNKSEINMVRDKYGLQGRKILFAPLQRPSDTVIKFFSGNIHNYDDFLSQLEKLQSDFKEKYAWALLCKKHPLEYSVESNGLLMADDNENIHALLDAADAVVCVNSGVGLLSVLHDKPVFHFGRTFYSHPKLTRQVQSHADVLYHLRHEPRWVDRETRNRLCHHLVERVYSFGTLKTELVQKKNGSRYRRTTAIDFDVLRFPEIIQRQENAPTCLFVTPVVPTPLNRGSVARTQQMLDSLIAAGCSVDLKILNNSYPEKSRDQIEIEVRKRFPAVRRVSIVHHPRLRRQNTALKRFFQRAPDRVRKLAARFAGRQYDIGNAKDLPTLFIAHLQKFQRNQIAPYDLVWFNYAKMVTPSIRRLGHRTIVDTHDVQTLRIKNDVLSRFEARKARKLFTSVEKSERARLEQCDRVVAISEVDADFFAQAWGLEEKTVLVEAAMSSPSTGQYGMMVADAAFIGSASVANIESLSWFIKEVTPIIDRIADRLLVIRIVGAVASNRRIRDELSGIVLKNIHFFLDGFVPSLNRVYASSRIILAPIVQGSGMKIKVVEALAHGKAVVGTSTAFDGIQVVNGASAMISDSTEGFAKAVTDLCRSGVLRADLETRARAVFERDHSQAKSDQTVAQLLRSLLGET